MRRVAASKRRRLVSVDRSSRDGLIVWGCSSGAGSSWVACASSFPVGIGRVVTTWVMLLEKKRSSLYKGMGSVMWRRDERKHAATYGTERGCLFRQLGPQLFRDALEIEHHLGKPRLVFDLPLPDPLGVLVLNLLLLLLLGLLVGRAFSGHGAGGPLRQTRGPRRFRRRAGRSLGEGLKGLLLQWRGLAIDVLSLHVGIGALLLGLGQGRGRPQRRVGDIGVAR